MKKLSGRYDPVAMERVCIACEKGEHDTAWSEAVGRVMQCDCECHKPTVKDPVWQIIGALLSVTVLGIAWLFLAACCQ